MKRLICCISIFLLGYTIAVYAQSQNQDNERVTKLESFISKKGSIVVKQIYYIGTVFDLSGDPISHVECHAVVTFAPGKEEERLKGLKINIKTTGDKLEKTNYSYLDFEEIESLSQGLKFISDLAKKWSASELDHYAEVVFSTAGNFRVGFQQDKAKQTFFVSSGSVYAFWTIADKISELKIEIDKALDLLKKK